MSQSHPPSAKPGPRYFDFINRLPALACVVLRSFSLFLRAVAPPQNLETTTCSLARAQRCLWATARCPHKSRTNQRLSCPYTGLRIPLARVGCVVPRSGAFRATTKFTNRDCVCFREELKKNDVFIRKFFRYDSRPKKYYPREKPHVS